MLLTNLKCALQDGEQIHCGVPGMTEVIAMAKTHWLRMFDEPYQLPIGQAGKCVDSSQFLDSLLEFHAVPIIALSEYQQ